MTIPKHPLQAILEQRIAIIDGAMGTTIRTYGMKEADIRGERFKDAKKGLLNNGDLFSLTKPEMIGDIHRRFLEAGADIIETNTFSSTVVAQADYLLEHVAYELNLEGARLAKAACEAWTAKTPDRPRFAAEGVQIEGGLALFAPALDEVVGALGPARRLVAYAHAARGVEQHREAPLHGQHALVEAATLDLGERRREHRQHHDGDREQAKRAPCLAHRTSRGRSGPYLRDT